MMPYSGVAPHFLFQPTKGNVFPAGRKHQLFLNTNMHLGYVVFFEALRYFLKPDT